MRCCAWLGLVCLFALISPLRAGLYPLEEKMPFPIRQDGTAEPLTYGFDPPGQMNFLISYLADMGKPTGDPGPKRKEALARIQALQARPASSLSPAEVAGLAADLFRTRQVEEAINLLTPRTRDRSPDFRILASLAHMHAFRGDWAEAMRMHTTALLDTEFPEELPGVTPAQRNWLKRVETEYYRKWLQIRLRETSKRVPPEHEEVLPLFPVRFVNEAGVYEPGQLAAAERAKLPPDAIAIVQQLILWHPDDARLHWLLGELYAADGRLREAEKIFDDAAWDRQYTNRKVLMDHRSAIKRAVELLPKPTESALEMPLDLPPTAVATEGKTPEEESIEDLGITRRDLYLYGALFGIVAVVMIAFQVRAIMRRFRRAR